MSELDEALLAFWGLAKKHFRNVLLLKVKSFTPYLKVVSHSSGLDRATEVFDPSTEGCEAPLTLN